MRLYPSSRTALAFALAIAAAGSSVRANTELDVANGTTDLTAIDATSDSDVTFTDVAYAPTDFTITAATVNFATLNDLDSTQTLTVGNAGPDTPSTLTLSGGGNAVSPVAADLLYVANGGILTINGGASTTTPAVTNTLLALILDAPGNLDIEGAANIGAATAWGSNAITKIGAGKLALTSSVANTSTGAFTIAEGAVAIGGGGNAGNTALGTAGTPVTFGGGSANTLLAFTAPESGISQNFTIAAGGGTRTITSSGGSATQGNAAVFAAANTITLNNNLILANLVASAPAANVFGFRGLISESGGSFGITVDATNVGTVDLRGANTFSGGVSLNGGTTTFNVSSSPNTPGSTVTAGPLGTGPITLGGDVGTAATLGDGSSFSIANPLTVGATTNDSTRTLMETSASGTAGSINSAVTLNSDLTLSAALVTSPTGNDRLRVGAGGITGASNIIISNPNTSTVLSTRAPIILTGSAAGPTAWTGNLIISQGQGALGLASTTASGLNAIGPNNTVLIGSGASFDFSSNAAGIGGFSPTIAGLADFGTITTPAAVFTSVTNNQTLIVAGSGAYAFSGTLQDSVNPAPNAASGLIATTALRVNLSTPAASQTLSGASTYTGGTTVNAGTLLVANTSGSALGAGNVTLNGGTLGGTGSIAGSVIPGTGPHTLQPGAIGAPGVLSIGGNLATNANTTLAFTLVSPTGTNGTLDVAGNVTLGGGTLAVTSPPANASSLGYYKVLSYAGTLTGSTSGITLPPIANNIEYTLVPDTSSIDVHVGYLGDVNDDGTVNASDLNTVLNNLGVATSSWAMGNFDGAPTIDLNDLNDVLNNLGTSIATGIAGVTSTSGQVSRAPAATPEPATLSLAAFGAATLLLRRKRR